MAAHNQLQRPEDAIIFRSIQSSIRFRLRLGRGNRLRVTLRDRILAKGHVTFSAHEIWILLTTVDFEIQGPTVINRRRNVTSFGAAAGTHRHLESFQIDCIESRARRVMTIQTGQVGVDAALVPECTGRDSAAPARQHYFVGAHWRRQLRVKVRSQLHGLRQLVARFTIFWFRRNA